MSNITLNIVEPSSPTPAPVDPGIDPSVPSTGLFTHGIGTAEATVIAITSTVLLLTIVAIVVAILYKKHKAQNKTTKLVHLVDSIKAIITNKKRATAALTAIALLVSAGTFIALAKSAVNATDTDEQAEGEDDSSLTVDVSSEELTIEMGDEPVFAVLPVEVSVEEATQAGYTLTAYAEDTDLVSTTDPDNTIPMIAIEGADLEALTDNTYGLALGEEPTSKDSEVYTVLSTNQSNPTIIKSMTEYIPTEANDTTTIYYGFYITSNTPYGTYEGADIHYNATINTTLVTFDGNGLYFNDEEGQTTNEIEYIAVPQENNTGENNETETNNTINQIISGEYLVPGQSLPYNFLGWSTDSTATVPTYTSEQSIAEFLPILPNTPLTLYAVWQKATTITFNGNGADSGTMDTQTIIAGESANLYPNEFTKEGYHFTGWNIDAEGQGQAYADEAEYNAPANTSQYLTLYAQWEEDALYMQDVATWGSTLAQGDEITVVDNRDGKGYTVARLADGNIWMTQNLDFDITNNGVGLDSSNTDVPDDWGDAGKLANTYTAGTTTWNSSTTAPESYDPGTLYWDGVLVYDKTTCEEYGGTWYEPGYRPSYCDGANPIAPMGDSHYHLGNYYNWTAAVAMNNSSAYTTQYQDANQSICPAGWRLPTYSGDKSYENLISVQGLTAGTSGNIQNSPAYFIYSGYWNGSSHVMGNGGYYWSSIVHYSGSYGLYFDVTGTLTQSSSNRGYGILLRCVTR